MKEFNFKEFKGSRVYRGKLSEEEQDFLDQVIEYLQENRDISVSPFIKWCIEKGYSKRPFNSVYVEVIRKLRINKNETHTQ